MPVWRQVAEEGLVSVRNDVHSFKVIAHPGVLFDAVRRLICCLTLLGVHPGAKVHPWVRGTLVLDVGARVAVDSGSGQQASSQGHYFVAPRTQAMTGRPFVARRGATAVSVVSDILGAGSNCTCFPYMLLTGICNLVGKTDKGLLSTCCVRGLVSL